MADNDAGRIIRSARNRELFEAFMRTTQAKDLVLAMLGEITLQGGCGSMELGGTLFDDGYAVRFIVSNNPDDLAQVERWYRQV